MNEVLEIVNPVLVTLSSLIIIIGSVVTLFRKKVRENTLFLYETHVKRRNGIEIMRKTDNEHLVELRNENSLLKSELEVFRKDSKPMSFKQRVYFAVILIITLPLALILMQKFQKTLEKQ